MLTPEQIQVLRDAAGQIADPINDFLLDDIARRIAGAGQLTSTAAYQVWRAQQLGLSQRELKKRLRELLKVSHRDLRRLLTQSAEVGYEFDLKNLPYVQALPFRENAAVQQMVAAAVKLAQDDFTNLTQTMGMVGPNGVALPLQNAYMECVDYAFEQVFTGAADYNTAIRRATKNLSKYGVRTIDYESGVHTSLEAATRRNIMGGLGLMVERIAQQNHDDLGCDGWEISAHAASAPDHEPIQGKQYSDAQYKALNNALVRRIGTLHCGHNASPIMLGVNAPQYTEKELEEFRRKNAEGITYEGRHYTMYEATQQQRKVERAIRRQESRILVDEATSDSEKLTTDRIRLQQLNQEYAKFSKATGLPTQRERTMAAGFGKGEAARAVKAVSDETGWKSMKATIGENAPRSLAEFKQIKYTGGERWRKAVGNQRLFEKIDHTDTYSTEYKAKMKETYQYFLNEGFEFREHALNRVLGQKSGPGKFGFTREQLLSVLQRPLNYQQSDGKLVRFYDEMAAITAQDTGEVVSIVIRSQPKKDWGAL